MWSYRNIQVAPLIQPGILCEVMSPEVSTDFLKEMVCELGFEVCIGVHQRNNNYGSKKWERGRLSLDGMCSTAAQQHR